MCRMPVWLNTYTRLEPLSSDALGHVEIGGGDQVGERRCVDRAPGSELHMAHRLSRAHQEALRIGQLSPSEKSDVHVSLEGIDVRKGRLPNARRWSAVVDQLPDVISATADHGEPLLREGAQFPGVRVHPSANGGVSLCRGRKSEELSHWREQNDGDPTKFDVRGQGAGGRVLHRPTGTVSTTIAARPECA